MKRVADYEDKVQDEFRPVEEFGLFVPLLGKDVLGRFVDEKLVVFGDVLKELLALWLIWLRLNFIS